MTNTQLHRKIRLEQFMMAFAKGPQTLKDLSKIMANPHNLIYSLERQGYIIKEKWGSYVWAYPIKIATISNVAALISKEWNKRQVYVKPKLLREYSDQELLRELQRRKL